MAVLDLDTIVLDKGAHSKPEEGGCAMEWVSVFAGLPWSDSPSCTDPVVASYVRTLNDLMPDDQRQRLIPYIPKLEATSNGVSRQTRAFMCANFAIHVLAPIALRAINQEEQAAKLEALPKVQGVPSANAASAASAAAWAAARAAWAAEEAARASAASATARAEEAARAAARAAWAARAADSRVWDEALRLLDLLIEAKPE